MHGGKIREAAKPSERGIFPKPSHAEPATKRIRAETEPSRAEPKPSHA